MGAVVAIKPRLSVRGTVENGSFRLFPSYRDKMHPRGQWVYAVELSDGRLKIGISDDPRYRIQQHWRTHEGLRWAHVFGFLRGSDVPMGTFRQPPYVVERQILAKLAAVGQRVGRTECFRGVDKATAILICREAIASHRVAPQEAAQ